MAAAQASQMASSEAEPLLEAKIIILGAYAVGKTSMLHRFNGKGFSESHLTTLGIDFLVKNVRAEGWFVKATFWDTAGQERLESLGKMTLRGCHGALIVYNNYDDKSFQCAKRFIRMVQEAEERCALVLVASKCDILGTPVSVTEREKLIGRLGCPFFETSAKTNSNITAAFERVAVLAAEVASSSPSSLQDVAFVDIGGPLPKFLATCC